MEEIKELVNLIKDLPNVAVWILVLFWIYKLVIAGSFVALARLTVLKISEYFMQDKVIKCKLGTTFMSEISKNALTEAVTNFFPYSVVSDYEATKLIDRLREFKISLEQTNE